MNELLAILSPILQVIGAILGGYVGVQIAVARLDVRVTTCEKDIDRTRSHEGRIVALESAPTRSQRSR